MSPDRPRLVHNSSAAVRVRKQILYCGPDRETFQALIAAMEAPDTVSATWSGDRAIVEHPRAELVYLPAHTIDQALAVLASEYLHMIVVDLRWSGDDQELEDRIGQARTLISTLDDVEDVEARYGFHRIVVLVSGPDGARIDDLLVELGGKGIRHVLKERRFRGDEQPEAYARRVVDESVDLMLSRKPVRTALCCAGGGITAIYFELGALKCFDDVLDGTWDKLDMYFGISAGAVVTSTLANGYSAEEFMASLAGYDQGRIAPMNLSVARLGHLNVQDMRWRLGQAARAGARGLWRMARGRGGPTIDDVFLGATGLVGAPFHAGRYEHMLRSLLAAKGSVNDFRDLERPLFIGATNQDTRRHTLFGSEGWDHVPISKAVQASLSINPAFSAVEIEGAWYEDGAVTRTSNFGEAIRRGANLIFVLDPFLPYHSKQPSYALRRGMLYNIDQDVRSLSYTRYETARNQALRRRPEVRNYTFLPNNRLRQLLSLNPMDHRPYLEIFRQAYLGTLRRIQAIEYRLRGDLAQHGIALHIDRAEAIAERLRAAEDLQFSDFFVDGKVELRQPALTLERRSKPHLAEAG